MMKLIKAMTLGVATAITAVSVPASDAQAATVTFDPLEQAGAGYSLTGASAYVEAGVRISGGTLFSAQQSNRQYAGSAGLHKRSGNGLLLLDRVDGALFQLDSIDVSILDSCGSCQSPLVTFTGFFGSGGTITQTFQPLSFGFATVSFSGFTGLTRVEWRQGTSQSNAHQVDNISVSAVPLPAAAALLGGALVLFGAIGTRRRRKISA